MNRFKTTNIAQLEILKGLFGNGEKSLWFLPSSSHDLLHCFFSFLPFIIPHLPMRRMHISSFLAQQQFSSHGHYCANCVQCFQQ